MHVKMYKNYPDPQVKNKRLPKPYTNGCINKHNNPDYRQRACLKNCVLSGYLNCNGCSLYDTSDAGCRLLDGYECAFTTIESGCDCKPMCEDETYEYTTSVSKIPNRYTARMHEFQGWPTDNVTEIENKYVIIKTYSLSQIKLSNHS